LEFISFITPHVYNNFYLKKLKSCKIKENCERKIQKYELSLFFIRINKKIFIKLIGKAKDKFRLINFKIFFKKLKTKCFNSKKNKMIDSRDIRDSLSFSEIDELKKTKKYLFISFIKKLQIFTKKKKIKNKNIKYFWIGKFLKIINSKITVNSLKMFKTKLLLTNNVKKFLKIVYKNIDRKFYIKNIKIIYKNIIIKSSVTMMQSIASEKILERQIKEFYKIKLKKRMLKGLKHNYMNKIKYFMIKDRFNHYLTITNLRALSNIISQNK